MTYILHDTLRPSSYGYRRLGASFICTLIPLLHLGKLPAAETTSCPTPDPPPTATPTPTPTTTGSPIPTPSQQQYLEAKWLSVGDLKPLEFPSEVPSDYQSGAGLSPSIDGEHFDQSVVDNDPTIGDLLRDNMLFKPNPGSYPNNYSAFNVQGVYGRGIDSEVSESSTVLMGGYVGAVFDVQPGAGLTRHGGEVNQQQDSTTKHVIGSYSQSLYRRGGSRRDLYGAVQMNVPSVSLSNVGTQELAEDWKEQPIFIDAVIAADNQALIGGPLADEPDPPQNQPPKHDLRRREAVYHPTNVRFLVGTNSRVAIDGALAGSADCGHGSIFSTTYGTLINAGIARALTFTLSLSAEYSNTLHGGVSDATTARAQSYIDKWIGILLKTPSLSSGVQLQRAAGLSIHSQKQGQQMTPEGPEIAHPATDFSSPLKRPPRRDVTVAKGAILSSDFPSLHTDGDLVVGDGEADPLVTGYDTDVFHARDIVQFESLDLPPNLDNLPLPERVGIIYFDVNGFPPSYPYPGLYVSVPRTSEELTEADTETISWKRIVFDATALSPSDVRKGNDVIADEQEYGESSGTILANIKKVADAPGQFLAPRVAIQAKNTKAGKTVRIQAIGFSDPTVTVRRYRVDESGSRGKSLKTETGNFSRSMSQAQSSAQIPLFELTIYLDTDADVEEARGPSWTEVPQEEGFLIEVGEDGGNSPAIVQEIPADFIFTP